VSLCTVRQLLVFIYISVQKSKLLTPVGLIINTVFVSFCILQNVCRLGSDSNTCCTSWVCHGSSPPGLYPSIRVRTEPPVSVRVRVRVSSSIKTTAINSLA